MQFSTRHIVYTKTNVSSINFCTTFGVVVRQMKQAELNSRPPNIYLFVIICNSVALPKPERIVELSQVKPPRTVKRRLQDRSLFFLPLCPPLSVA